MAGATAKSSPMCSFYFRGACTKGKNCPFLHDKPVCKFYQSGHCRSGSSCRYKHDSVNEGKGVSPKKTEISPIKPVSFLPNTNNTPGRSSMVKLTFDKKDKSKWVDAKEFVPRSKLNSGVPQITTNQWADGPPKIWNDIPFEVEEDPCDDWALPENCTGIGGLPPSHVKEDSLLCPYYAHGRCPYGEDCGYAHGDICDMCGMPRLHPVNERLRDQHIKECIAEHEQEMERAFAFQASEDKECGVCLQKILELPEGRFGILENCNHCFCIKCIRQWRGNTNSTIDKDAYRSCPICRTTSNFITPSNFWVESPRSKRKLIDEYKTALRTKPCQFFKEGKGSCPFNNSCFYLHALENGEIVYENVVQSRRRKNESGDIVTDDLTHTLWDFFDLSD